MTNMKPVLMCGGVGSKMWPLSRKASPKHFLPLVGEKSLFQINYQTLRKKFTPKQIFVQTNEEQAKIAQKQAPEIPKKNYFIEPEMRNHGPATGLMAAKLFALDPDEPFINIQTDVIRTPENKFLEMIDQIDELIRKKGKLVTGGIRPTYAIMGVDYLLAEKKVRNTGNTNIYRMNKWLGRDAKNEVENYLKKKAVFAHANHYAWTPRLIIDAYKRLAPDWYGPLKKIIDAVGTKKEKRIIAEQYSKMEKAPIERITSTELNEGYVVELPFQWIDFGTWESVAEYEKDQQKNKKNNNILLDSKNCFIKTSKSKTVAVIGINDLVVVDSGDALLVCTKKQTGRVGEIVDQLKELKIDQLL
jgi:mannose-1-phosphate guanylyltransferase